MRKYLLKKGIKRIYSSYGASDLELNISSENPFTISLRGLINENQELKNRIVKFSALRGVPNVEFRLARTHHLSLAIPISLF